MSKGQLDAGKYRMFMQITNERKHMRTAYFTRKLNVRISHNEEIIEFPKFQGKLLLSNELCSSWEVLNSTCCT